MKKTLALLVFLAVILAPALAQTVEPIAEAPDSPDYYSRYFYISINDRFLLGDKVEARVCGSGIATLEVYRFEDLSLWMKGFSYYSDSQGGEFLKNEKPFKVVTLRRGMGKECRTADLQIGQAGFYFVKGYSTDSENTPTEFFSVEEIALMAKSSNEKTLFYAVEVQSGKPISGAEIILMESKNSWTEKNPEITEKSLGFTSELGLLEWQREKPKENEYSSNIFIAKKGGSFAFVTDYSYWHSEQEQSLYLFTERPIYRPEQEVYFKGILWKSGIEKAAIPGEKIEITIRDSKYTEVFRETYATNEFGSFEGSFSLSEEPPLGYYSMQAKKGETYLGNASFQVQEYRKPEFEVKVNPSKEAFVGGEKARVEIKAEYLFKAPVQNAKAMYRVYSSYYQSPCHGYWRCAYYEMPYDYYSDYYYPYYYSRQLVTEGEAITDSEGKAFIEFDTNADREKRYYIEATVVDESNRQVNGSGQIIVAPALFRLSVTTDKWWYSESEKAKIMVALNDFEDNTADSDVLVKIFGVQWNIESKKYDRVIVKEETLFTNEGKAEFLVSLPEGQYAIEATAVDSKGNTAKGGNSFSVSSYAAESKVKEMEASLDRDLYLPGESALLTIKMPEPSFYALVSVEGRGIFSHDVVFSGKNPLSYLITVSSDHQPNAFIYITGVQGGKVFTKSLSLNVPPKEKKIDLSIETNSEYYRPSGKAHYKVKATSQGQPVEAEFAIMIVDEAIFQLAKDNKQDIFKFFFAPEYNRVRTRWSLGGYYYDYRYSEVLGGGGGPMPTAMSEPAMDQVQKEGGETQYAAAEIRKTFADTAFWKAFLKTDSSGTAQFEVDLPDNLTTWRATAVASSKTKAGAGESKIAVTKDVIARLIVPKFAVKGDEFLVKAIVHNSLPEMKNTLVSIEADNLEFPDGNEMEITIASGKSETAEFRATAKKCCSAKIKLEALTDIESDGLEIIMPILPWGVKEFETISGEAKEKTTLNITIPENTDRDADKLIITLNPTLAASIIDSLDYLTGYPYGCVEQTMSRFLPDVVVAQTLKELGLKNEKLEAELPDMVEKGLQKLYGMQSSDGGWGWWYNDSSQPFMTAYVMYGLTLAKKAGFEARESVFDSGKKALIEKFPDATYSRYYDYDYTYKTEKDRELRAFISYVLYLNGDSRFVQEVKAFKGELSDYGKALLLLQLESSEEAQPLLDELGKSASCDSVFCSWKGKSWRAYWSEKDMETTAMVLKALVKWAPEDEKARKAINWLMSKKEYNGWRSTQDTATAVMAISDYLKYSGELEPNYTAGLYVNNELKKEFSVTKENILSAGGKIEIKVPAKQSQIRIEMEGKGKLYYSITKEYFSQQEKIEAKSNGITVKRTVESTIDTGQEIKVTLAITAEIEYDYVVIEDFLPAGTIVVDSRPRNRYGYYYWDWHPYWYSQMEARDEKTVFFFNRLKQGTTEVAYTIRGEVPGTFRHLPVQAHAMYNPEINGYSGGGTFTVTEKKSFSLPKLEVRKEYIWIYPRPIPMEATVKAEVLDASGNQIAAFSGKAEDGKIAIPLKAGLANGAYSVSVSTESGTATKEFQVGTIQIKKAELSPAAYFNELLERTAQPALPNPAQALCSSTGGSWANWKCSCPLEKYWLSGMGCIARETGPTPGKGGVEPTPGKYLALDPIAIALAAGALIAIVLAFIIFMGTKPLPKEKKKSVSKTWTEKAQKEPKWKFKEKEK